MAASYKRLGWATACLVLLIAAPVSSAASHSRTQSAKPVDTSPAALAQAKQKLEQQQAQVKQLQDNVARQESDSKQASERLQKQDQTISQMQQELKALQAKQGAGHR